MDQQRCYHCGVVVETAINGEPADAETRSFDCAARPGQGHEIALHTGSQR